MRTIKSICYGMLLFCFLFILAGTRTIAESSGDQQIQLWDQADLLTGSQENRITDLVNEVELSANWDIMVVSTDDTGGETSEAYAEEWYDQYCTGDDGVICLIDMQNRELVIRTFGEAIYYLTDERLDTILNHVYSEASTGDYYRAYESMVEGVLDALQRGIPQDQYTYDEDSSQVIGTYREDRHITAGEGILAVAAALASGGITIAAVVGKYRLKWGNYQYSFRENGSVELSRKSDTFVNQIVTHRRIPKENSGQTGSSHRGRSTTHVGAGQRRSGGGSRKF